jgi:hypothetical protein
MDELAYIFSSFFPLFFIGIFAFLIPRIQGKIFKELKENFKTDEKMPAGSFRIQRLQCGQVKLNNIGKVAENIKGMYLYIPFKTVLRIPFTEITEVKIKDAFFGQKAISLTFNRPGIKPITLIMQKKILAQLPNLMKTAKHEPIEVLAQASQNPFIKSDVGNFVRIFILILALIAGIGFFVEWYVFA